MVDKNLFLHDLAIVAILKCEGPYLKEWLNYHLLAGVNHFYLYDNDSPDNQAEVAAPYVEAGLVDYIPAPGKKMQMAVYNDAVKRFKFFCRYMAFVDGDEFILPKSNRGVAEVVDEILSHTPNAAGLAINWQVFGSNGQEKADYSRSVPQRFTRRAPSDWDVNKHIKTIANPRRITLIDNPHSVQYFAGYDTINERGEIVSKPYSESVTVDKIAINHYYYMSREEFSKKAVRGDACTADGSKYSGNFDGHDHNDIYDDSILSYRAARVENFSIERHEQKFSRVINALTKNLSLFANDTPPQNSLETALTCRALSTYLRKNFPDDADYWKICEEASLAAVLQSFDRINLADARFLLHELPELLSLPYPTVKELRQAVCDLIQKLMDGFHSINDWKNFVEFDYIKDMLKI